MTKHIQFTLIILFDFSKIMDIQKNYLENRWKKKPRFSFMNCSLFLIILIVVGVVISYFWFRSWYCEGINKPNSDDSSIVIIEIQPGMTPDQIGRLLLDKGLIQDKTLWDFYIRINNIGSLLIADTYRLRNNLSMKQIADILQGIGGEHIIWVTFPEGLRISQIVTILQKRQEEFNSNVFNINEFSNILQAPDHYIFSENIQLFLNKYKPESNSLEGFLYPNTYALEADMSAKDIVEIMLDEFIKQVDNLDIDNGKYSFYDALILASIVERESFNDQDRKIVAGIFDNRLEINWPLQADATINYITGKNDRMTIDADRAIASPYNTYKYIGLPPAPICNPRIESIKYSLSPIDTDYFYFIHALDGTPYYAVTENEHFDNVNKYLEK